MICNGAPTEALDTEVWMSFPGWQYSAIVTHQWVRRVMYACTAGREQQKPYIWDPPRSHPINLLLAGSNLYLFDITQLYLYIYCFPVFNELF